ncbi:hypothetical protein [Streptomyces sp. SID2888]|uniref:hypothetical protein n=1 Tax=Streptomyces sp. SID2888 TaxID=2690256 RepID=UPI00136A2E1C|nr:hypothetical protein [Streptomyces sp. SID2888]MYV50721.1 hypothetical protein [Streptomyces sp. SID2888]
MAARRRRSAVTAALAAVAVFAAVGTSAGCGAAGRAVDCVGTADAIADGVTDLQQTVERTANEPTPTVTSPDPSGPSDPSGAPASPASPAPPVSPDPPASRDSHDTLHSLETLEEKLEGFGGETDDVDVGKAVDALRESVGEVREAVEGGESSPDLGPVTDAAGELTKACTA